MLEPGAIIVTRGGVSILGCPACGKMQFAAAVPSGPAAAPHITRPIQCGSGFCKRCGEWFRIINGVPERVPPAERPVPAIPPALAAAGVRRAPRDPSEVSQ